MTHRQQFEQARTKSLFDFSNYSLRDTYIGRKRTKSGRLEVHLAALAYLNPNRVIRVDDAPALAVLALTLPVLWNPEKMSVISLTERHTLLAQETSLFARERGWNSPRRDTSRCIAGQDEDESLERSQKGLPGKSHVETRLQSHGILRVVVYCLYVKVL